MKIYGDTISIIGDMHVRSGKPNQDFALVSPTERGMHAVVSDGCSSGGQTDVGARLVALATARAHAEQLNEQDVSIAARADALLMASSTLLNLRSDDLLATCLSARVEPQGADIVISGDGVVVVGFSDGSLRFANVSWAQNMPFYPVYRTHGLMDHFVQMHGGRDAQAVTLEMVNISVDDTVNVMHEMRSAADGTNGIRFSFSAQEVCDLSFVGVFSDGVCAMEQWSWIDVARELTAFKNLRGQFLVRRVMRVVRDAAKEGVVPQDDLSGAVLAIEHDDVEVCDERKS